MKTTETLFIWYEQLLMHTRTVSQPTVRYRRCQKLYKWDKCHDRVYFMFVLNNVDFRSKFCNSVYIQTLRLDGMLFHHANCMHAFEHCEMCENTTKYC